MKRILPSIRIALRALRANTMRSSLTVLGIVIGVAAVIAMMAVGAGATARIEQQIASIGSNVIVVFPGSVTTSGMRMGGGSAMTLTEDDAKAVGKECPLVDVAAPVSRGGAQTVFGNANWATSVEGSTPEYFAIRQIQIASGSAFTSQDVDSAAKVALVGTTVAKNLFGGADPVGETIRIRKVPFRVIGVLASRGQTPMGQDQDDTILLPLSTAKKKVLGGRSAAANAVGSILVLPRDAAQMKETEEEMRALLRQRHHLTPGQEDDFTIRNVEEAFAAQEASARVMSILLAAIASVSLLVGGIGIMNIMLVSVTERTREIGLRQAVGAKMKDILMQFLVEAVTLSAVGGLIGITLGVLSSVLISYFADWSTVISPWSIVLAFVFSAVVGVAFGYYPARKAAQLDPIDALRYE